MIWQGCFDSAGASLRKAPAALSMTNLPFGSQIA